MSITAEQPAPSAPAYSFTSSRYETVPVTDLRRSLDNPRDPILDTDPEVLGLAESIRSLTQLQPVIVRDVGERPFEILAGERRWRGCTLAGKPVEARIVVCDDRTALQIIVIENLQRKNLSPLEEARGVATLLRRGYSAAEVCSALGETASWVEKRAKLVDLVPAWTDHLRDTFSWAGVGHLEQIARLPSNVQEELAKHYAELEDWEERPTTKAMAQHIADQYLHQLKSAPWSLEDATLVPAAGGCATCSRRSDLQESLFADLAAKAGARCLDASCWYRKVTAQTLKKAAELGESRRVVVIEKTGPHANPAPVALPAGAVRVESAQWYGAEAVSKSTPGATPVIDSETARVTWMRPRECASATVKRALGAAIPAPKPGEKPAATVATAQVAAARRSAKRYAWRLQAVGKAKDKAARPETDRLLRLLAILVIERSSPLSAGTWAEIESTKRSAADDLDLLWERVAAELPSIYEVVASTALPDLEAVQACEQLVGLRSPEQAELALAQIPEPEPKGKRLVEVVAKADRPGSGKVKKPKAAKPAKAAAKPAKAAAKKRGKA